MTPIEAVEKTLKDWIWTGKHASTSNFTIKIEEDGGRSFVRLKFVTITNSYSVRAFPPRKDGSTYMCCEYSNREPNPGETWTRGGDLADGSFNKETWDRIVADILSVELAEAAERTTA